MILREISFYNFTSLLSFDDPISRRGVSKDTDR